MDYLPSIQKGVVRKALVIPSHNLPHHLFPPLTGKIGTQLSFNEPT